MDNISLPRNPSTSVNAAREPKQVSIEADRSADNDFKDQLNEQIESTENVGNPKKISANQEDTKAVDNVDNADDVLEQGEEIVALAEPEVDTSEAINVETDLQITAIESGNDLPEAAAVSAAIVVGDNQKAVIKFTPKTAQETEQVSLNNRLANKSPLSPQALANNSNTQTIQTAEDSTVIAGDKSLPLETFKTLLNKQSQKSAPIAEGRLNPVSVVQQLNAATQLQQVPTVTSSVAINATSALPIDNASAASANALNSLQSSINVHVQSSAWSQGVTEKLSMMVNMQMQRAEIKLNPANLGPMEIQLSLKDDQASVNFISHHLPVREALDQALPRLREMFEQQGFDLVNVDVSQHSAGQESNSDDINAEQASDDNQSAAENELQANININAENIILADGVSIFA